MAIRWYESRTVQGAIIGGVALIIAATISVLGSTDSPSSSFFEIKTLGAGGEQALGRLALDPSKQLIDSSEFASLSESLVIIDSMGVAFARPLGQDWTVGSLGTNTIVDANDIPFLGFFTDLSRRGWASDTLRANVRYVGVRLDHPVQIRLLRDTRMDAITLGHNPFRDPSYAIGWIRMAIGDEFLLIPEDTLIAYGMELIRQMDSIIAVKLPQQRDVYSGVFIARLSRKTFPPDGLLTWLNFDLLEDVARYSRAGASLPSMLLLDKERGYAIINETFRLANLEVNSVPSSSLLINRIGYVVRTGEEVQLVLLQYLSADDPGIVSELQRVFQSVRLRGAP